MANNQSISFDEFVKDNQPSNWTREDFLSMTRKDLRYFAVWNGVACVLPKSYAERIAAKPMNVAAAALATEVYSTNESRNVASVRPETHLNTNGGSFTYYPKTVEQVKLSGPVSIRQNAPIPARFEETERYSNLVAVSAFSQTVKVKDGVWRSNVNIDSWNKVCGHQDCEIDVPKLKAFSEQLVGLLSKDGVWLSMSQVARNAVTGGEAMCFVREALNRLEPDLYDWINTKIVCEVLRTFYRVRDKWAFTLKSGKKERLISEKCYEKKKPSDKLARTLAGKYPGCYWYKGGVAPSAQFPSIEGDLKSTLSNVAKATEILGSDSSTSAILAQMRGYSALTDDYGKRIQWILGTVLGLWSTGKEAAIRLTTTGDVDLLASSLNKWRAKIKADLPEKFCTVTSEGMTVNSMKFSFILAQSKDKFKVNVIFHPLIRSRVPAGAVIVYYNEASLPSSHTKGEKPDYDMLSSNLVGEDIRGISQELGSDRQDLGEQGKVEVGEVNDYVVYTIIYGAAPFQSDPAVQRAMVSRTLKIGMWKKPVRVYSWGTAAKFHGVLTTLPAYQLIGWGMEKVGDSYVLPERESSNKFVSIRPAQVITQEEWYRKVAVDARMQPFAFLNPISRYSPISNLPFMSKAGLTFSQQRVESEEGVLIGNLVRVNREEDSAIVEFVPETDILEQIAESEKPKNRLPENTSMILPSSSLSSQVGEQRFVEVDDEDIYEGEETNVVYVEQE